MSSSSSAFLYPPRPGQPAPQLGNISASPIPYGLPAPILVPIPTPLQYILAHQRPVSSDTLIVQAPLPQQHTISTLEMTSRNYSPRNGRQDQGIPGQGRDPRGYQGLQLRDTRMHSDQTQRRQPQRSTGRTVSDQGQEESVDEINPDILVEHQQQVALDRLETDMNCFPPTEFTIKLEIPLPADDVAPPIGDAILVRLPRCSGKESLLFSESGCINQFIYTLKFCGTPFDIFEEILGAAQFPYKLGANDTRPFFFKFSEDNFFHKRLLNQMNLMVSSVDFGTLLPGQNFVSHWDVNYSKERAHPYKQWMKDRFKARFLFDERRIFSVDIWNYQKNEKRPNFPPCLEHYTLSADKNQVQRLIVCVKKNGPTVLYLELAYPASIYKGRHDLPLKTEQFGEPNQRYETICRGRDGYELPAKGVLAENKFIRLKLKNVTWPQLYLLLSRFTARTHIPVEVGHIQTQNVFIGKGKTYVGGPEHLIDKSYYGIKLREALPGNETHRFQLTYLIMCLYSLGAIVKDQIALDELSHHAFVDDVARKAQTNFNLCTQVLESLVRFLNMRKKHKPVMEILDDFYESSERGDLSILPHDERMLNKHFERIGLVALTPTRVLFKCPEIHMGNTVSRKLKDNTLMLRIIVREDDGCHLRYQNHGEKRFREIVADKMEKGISIYGKVFKFFGSSGSQQREMGMYFMDESRIAPIWKYLGHFDNIQNMYKRLAREGQSLTQSMRYSKEIKRNMWSMTPDYKGGRNRKDQEYCFSDGCGKISRSLMEAISKELKLGTIPCAIQFRFLGFKGMLAVDPDLVDYHLEFRDSQCKFGGRTEGYLEVVKPALPQSANLSRPFINILCQNSTNPVTHQRILNRFLDLYEMIFKSLAYCLTDEKKFREVLKELPFLIDIDFLDEAKGFILSQEPLFRSLVIAYVKQKLHQQINKISLPMPPHLGRSLFGVVDETGLLDPGEVFVQWSKSLKTSHPAWNRQRVILEGKVTVTKNPCLAAGDVRIFTAVNIPELAERYYDVIVFPNHGSRPHPDEMAGSDLDGDEYTVVCDDELLLDRNEKAFDYVADGNLEPNPTWQGLSELRCKIEHLLDYFQKNKIGVFADAQMDASDIYGINSAVSKNLIKKTCQALDFAKSGLPPEDLTTAPTKDRRGNEIPREKSTRKADFKRKEENGPTYASERMNGILHRSNRQLSSLITMKENETAIKKNPVFDAIYENYSKKVPQARLEELEAKALSELNTFLALEKPLLDNYGIATEAEVFSNCILQMTNILCEREEDDGSTFTTANILQKMAINLFKRYRESFFEEFDGGWMGQTEYIGKMDARYDYESLDVTKRRVKSLNNQLVLKAVIYYKLCYERAIRTGEKFLIFGWLANDVLAKAQDRQVAINADLAVEKESFHDELERAILTTTDGSREDLCIFLLSLQPSFTFSYLKDLLKRYGGVVFKILYFLNKWAKRCDLITSTFTEENFIFLVMLVSSGKKMECGEAIMDAFGDNPEHEEIEVGKALAMIMDRLSTRKVVEKGMTGTKYEKGDGQKIELDWERVYEAARKSFLTMCIYQRFDELVGTPAHVENMEKEVLTIELPENIDLEEIRETLITKTGLDELTLRRKNPKRKTYVTILFRGNSNSEEKLRNLVQLPLPKNIGNCHDIDQMMPYLVHRKIMGLD